MFKRRVSPGGAGSVWGTDYVRGVVVRIDPRTNRVVARIKTGASPSNLRYGAGAVWVGSQTGTAVFRIDPATNRSTPIETKQQGPASPAVSAGAVWVSANLPGTVTRIDPVTGRPSLSRWEEVTVCGATCLAADVAAKAAFLLDDEGPDWLDERGLPGRFRVGGAVHENRSWRESVEPRELACT